MLFGREVELGHVDAVVRAARDSGPAVLVLRGEPGIGKSALLRHASNVGQDLSVLSARAVETESGLPFAFVSALARPLMSHVVELPTTQSRCLRAALGEEKPGATDAFLLGAALLGLFAEASREQPLLLLLDDVHWADEVSLRAVVFALLRLERDPVGAILTHRDVDVPSVDSSGFPRISPARLDIAAATALIAAVRGEQPSAGVATQLAEATGGNPLALVELAGSLDGAAFSGRSGLPAPLPVGEKLLNVYGQRVRGLPLETQRALLVAAASDERTSPVLQALAALGGNRDDLDAAEHAGLITVTDTITFRHPLIRTAVLDSANPTESRRVHRALSRVPLVSIESQAWHLAAAAVGQDAAAAEALTTAAGSAVNRGDPASAAEMWARAAELAPEAEQRAPLFADAAEAADSAGRFERCQVLAEAGLRAAPEPFIRGRLLRLMAFFDEPRQSHALLLEAASLLAPQDNLAATRAISEAVWAGLAIRSVELVRQAVNWAEGQDRSADAPTTLLRACLVGYGLAITGDLAAALPHFDIAITAIRQDRSLRDDPVALADAIEIPGFFGRVDLTHDLVEHGLRSARASGAVSLLPRLVAERACVATWRAEWTRATALTAEAADLCLAMGNEAGHSFSAYQALFHAHRGDIASATHAARNQLRWAEASGMTSARDRPTAIRALAILDLRDGRPERALRRLLAEAQIPIDARGVRNGPLTVVEDLVEAALLAGRPDAAKPAVDRLSSYARVSPDPLASALAARCRALLADGGDQALDEYGRALSFHDRDPDAFATARTRLCFGEWLRRKGRRVDARDHLYAALEVFDRLDAVPWSQRAGAELRATGESISRRDETRVRLTAQELRTAMAVAEGLTNREAAERLFVTVKTVEFHLGSVYRKLGIHSRVELVRHLLITG